MNRSITFVLLIIWILMVPTACFAQDEQVFPYKGECPHELLVLPELLAEHQQQLGEDADAEGYLSAQCQYCGLLCMLYPPAERGVAAEKQEKNRVHAYRKINMRVEEGWYPVDTVTHEYRMYYHAQCEHCGYVIRYYIVREADPVNDAFHIWADDWIDVHVADHNMHMYITTCVKCDYAYGYSNICDMYDNGLCKQQMLEALRRYGLE